MMMNVLKLTAALALVVSCKGRDRATEAQHEPVASRVETMSTVIAGEGGRAAPNEEAAMALDEGKLGKAESERGGGRFKASAPAVADVDSAGHGTTTGSDSKDSRRGGDAETSVRAWFPETFLFDPLVVTDDSGRATVSVRVPDRLTSWRVLALAHSRQGAQGGATTSFLGTLPTYVDLVVPKFLVVGDVVKLPIQIVNTTDMVATAALDLSVEGATLTGGSGPHAIPAQSGAVVYATLAAKRPGTIKIKATLGGTDAVVRTIEVRPSGRPETITQTGTLAAPRTVSLAGPAGSDPQTDRVRLLVYPGALSLLRAELGVSTSRSSVADDGYALLLAGRADKLLVSLGDQADPDAIRTLSILTGQRVIRDARTLDVTSATLLVEPALAHPHNPVLARIGERAAAYLAEHQRPDGTFAGGAGWTLQRVMMATADATRAVAAAHASTPERQRLQGVQMRAASAFERAADQVPDAFTAAAILASGAVKGPFADKLRARVKSGIKAAPDGSKYLDVPDGVVRADGQVPSRAEATGLAVLALLGDPTGVADLGGTLLGSYSPERGWGDGRANLVCMQAVIELFKTPVPEGVKITLTMDGKPVSEGLLDRAALKEVLALEGPAPDGGFSGPHEWKLVAEPAVPGLGYALSLRGWVPWQTQTTQQGLEMSMLPASVSAEIGRPIEITLAAIAPSNTELQIMQSLPAGVQVDTPSLEALVAAGTITKFEATDGKLEMTVPGLAPGATFAATYKVIPTLVGSLRSAASSITAAGTTFDVPPATWTVR